MITFSRRVLLLSAVAAPLVGATALAQERALKGEVINMSSGARCVVRRASRRRTDTCYVGTRLYEGDEVLLRNAQEAHVTIEILGAFQVTLTADAQSFVVPSRPTWPLILGDIERIIQELGDAIQRTREHEHAQTLSDAGIDRSLEEWGAVVGVSDYIDAAQSEYTTWVMAAPRRQQIEQSRNVYYVTRETRAAAGQVLTSDAVYTIASDAPIRQGLLRQASVDGRTRTPDQRLGFSFTLPNQIRPFTYYVAASSDGDGAYNLRALNVPESMAPAPPWGERPNSDSSEEIVAYGVWLATRAGAAWELEGLGRIRGSLAGMDVPDEYRTRTLAFFTQQSEQR